jgi:putative tricarboxylic transport membrane protein
MAGALAVAAAVCALGVFFVAGAFSIEGDAQYAGVGPRVFPFLIGGALVILGATLALFVLRRPVPVDSEPVRRGALGWIVAGLALAIATMQPLGFPVAAAIVFVLTARGFGSRRPGRDVVMGIALGALVYVVFSRGLGVSLPGGLFITWGASTGPPSPPIARQDPGEAVVLLDIPTGAV